MILFPGCRTIVRPIASDRIVHRIEPGTNYVFDLPGWFVPDALMLDLNRELADKRLQVERAEPKP